MINYMITNNFHIGKTFFILLAFLSAPIENPS